MRIKDFLKECRKSEGKSGNAEVFVVQKDGPILKVDKVRTKGDMVLIYVEQVQNEQE